MFKTKEQHKKLYRKYKNNPDLLKKEHPKIYRIWLSIESFKGCFTLMMIQEQESKLYQSKYNKWLFAIHLRM